MYQHAACMAASAPPAPPTPTCLDGRILLRSLITCEFAHCAVRRTYLTAIGHTTPSFLDKAINRHSYTIVLISESNFPASIIFIRSVSVLRSLLSLSPMSRLIRCWGVRQSGSPDKPRGNVRRVFLTLSELICNEVYLKLSVGSMVARRSVADPECFPLGA